MTKIMFLNGNKVLYLYSLIMRNCNLVLTKTKESMKKFFAVLFSVLLVAFLATSFTNTKSAVDKDVGYSLTIDQNVTTVTIVPCESPVVTGEVNYLIARGVSVPLKGPDQEAISNLSINQISPMCRIDNYRKKESISTNFSTPVKGIDLIASDLGTWERLQNKV